MEQKYTDAIVKMFVDKIESLESEIEEKNLEIKNLRKANIDLVKAFEAERAKAVHRHV